MKIVSTFKFPVKVAGKVIPKAETPWNIGDPLPAAKSGVKFLVNAKVFSDNPERTDFVMLNPEGVVRNEKGHAIEYKGFLVR